MSDRHPDYDNLTPEAKALVDSNPECGNALLAMQDDMVLEFDGSVPLGQVQVVKGQNRVRVNPAYRAELMAGIEADPRLDVIEDPNP